MEHPTHDYCDTRLERNHAFLRTMLGDSTAFQPICLAAVIGRKRQEEHRGAHYCHVTPHAFSPVQRADFTDQVSQAALGRVAGGHVGDWSCAGHPSYSLLKPWKWRGLQIRPSLACSPHHVWKELRSLPPTLATLSVMHSFPWLRCLLATSPERPNLVKTT